MVKDVKSNRLSREVLEKMVNKKKKLVKASNPASKYYITEPAKKPLKADKAHEKTLQLFRNNPLRTQGLIFRERNKEFTIKTKNGEKSTKPRTSKCQFKTCTYKNVGCDYVAPLNIKKSKNDKYDFDFDINPCWGPKADENSCNNYAFKMKDLMEECSKTQKNPKGACKALQILGKILEEKRRDDYFKSDPITFFSEVPKDLFPYIKAVGADGLEYKNELIKERNKYFRKKKDKAIPPMRKWEDL